MSSPMPAPRILFAWPSAPPPPLRPPRIDPAAATVTQVYINPDECIDCGNCASICAQNAIFSLDELPADKADFAEKNRGYFN